MILLGGLLGWPSHAQTSSDLFGFAIAPYLYLEHGANLSVAWQYKGSVSQRMKLPLPVCGFGNDQTYQVNGMSSPVSIKNIPCPQDFGPVKVTFLADTQEGTGLDAQFAHLIELWDPSAVIYGGDLVQNGSFNEDWQKFFDAMSVVNSHRAMIPVVGNHEYRFSDEAELWKEHFNFEAHDAFYSAWVGPVHVIVLNSAFEDDPTLIQTQLSFLEKELQLVSSWKVVVFHHPPYSQSIMQLPEYLKREYLAVREYYVPLFEKYGVDMVFNGHTHIYEHSLRNGIHYITTGAAGGSMGHEAAKNPFKTLPAQEVRTIIQIEASDDLLRATAVKLNGDPADDILLHKNGIHLSRSSAF